MEAKFTKGEWCIRLVNGQFAIMRHDTGYGICSTVMCDDTDKANANLIARAPNLYHALKRTNEELALLIDRYNKKVKDPAHFIDAETCHLNQIELAKARGEL